jgi:putative flavoprotein involved in K+ transport
VTQIAGSDYRDAASLPSGAVLVVGCGNSGGQIAEDLARSGRRVFLATGHNGRIPRRYRGRDIILWLTDTGRTAMPRTSSTGRPLLGADHTISLQSLSAHGIVVIGRYAGVEPDGSVSFADDLRDNAGFADRVSAEIRGEIDAYIERTGVVAPAAEDDAAEVVAPRFPEPPIRRLDLAERGIATVVWCIGFGGDFGWLRVPGALDADGQPVQHRGLSVPGVCFAGLDTPESMKAGTILVAEETGARIAACIATLRGGG